MTLTLSNLSPAALAVVLSHRSPALAPVPGALSCKDDTPALLPAATYAFPRLTSSDATIDAANYYAGVIQRPWTSNASLQLRLAQAAAEDRTDSVDTDLARHGGVDPSFDARCEALIDLYMGLARTYRAAARAVEHRNHAAWEAVRRDRDGDLWEPYCTGCADHAVCAHHG